MGRKPTTTRIKKTDDSLTPITRAPRTTGDLTIQIQTELKHKNERQKLLTTAIKTNDVVVCTGPAGTGKTFLSCSQALIELKTNQVIKKIVLVKSVTTLKSEEIGFLKGSMEEKMEPFMYSFTGNFEKLIGKELFGKLKTDGYIEILPIAYLRGVNIDNAIIIIDETQNISIDNIRTILTRLGKDSKMILLGDVKQIDSKNKFDSALKFLLDNFKNIGRIGIVEFTKEDIIRHPLVKVIEDIFDKVEATKLSDLKQSKPIPTSNNITNIKNKKSFFTKFLSFFK
jgi:phosphate starvation-inducible PhoH-like protein